MEQIVTHNNLKEIGKELNELLEPAPLIRVEVEYDSLLIDIIAACRLLESGDILTEKTVNDLKKLEIILPNGIIIKEESIVTKTNKVADDLLKSQSKKKGVIATIIESLENGPVTKQEILDILIKKFPERNSKSMKKTIDVRLPNGLKNQGYNVHKIDDGFIIK